MLVTFALIFPIFALIAGGYCARRTQFLPDAFWPAAEKLGYWVLLPALIVQSLATRELSTGSEWRYVLALVLTVVLHSTLLFVSRRFVPMPGPSFASVHQGTIRLNGLLAIAAGVALIGPESVPPIALMFAVWIPLSNGLSVYGFVRLATRERADPARIAWEVLRNPAVFSVIVGYALNVLGAGPLLERFILLDLLGRAALPVGLLAVGAALDLRAAAAASQRVIAATVLKLGVMPLVMIGLVLALDLDLFMGAVAIICACMPTSPSGYLVAKHLGGDAPLMATIITVQTLFSLLTVTLFAAYGVSLLTPP